MEYPLLHALLGLTVALNVDKEKGSYLSAANLGSIETMLAGIAAKDTELTTAKTDLATANATLSTTQTALTAAQEQLKTYANVPSKEHGAPSQNGDDRQPELNTPKEVDPEITAVLAMKEQLGIPNKL